MATVGRPRLIAIAEINVDPELQARCNINEDAVADYAEAMEREDRLPPIVVFFDGQLYWLADGFHRLRAHERIGRTHIACQVQEGSRDDAAWYALGANRPNGMRLNNADKARAVSLALRLHPERSNSLIARHIGVSDKTVAKRRDELTSGSEIPNLTARVGADGKAYPAAKPPAEPPPSIDDDDLPPSVDVDTPGPASEVATDGTPPPEPAPEPEPEPPVDKAGQPIPEHLLDAFERDEDLVTLCTTISKLKCQVMARIEAGDPLYGWIVPSRFEADCQNVRRQLSATRPHAVCPYCGGDGCRACRGQGWINEDNFKAAPKEIRG